MSFDPVHYAKQELAPLLFSLCASTESEGALDQHSFFSAILTGIEHSERAEDLAGPFMELSTSAFRGFHFSPHSTLLLDLVLEKAQGLSEALSLDPSDVH